MAEMYAAKCKRAPKDLLALMKKGGLPSGCNDVYKMAIINDKSLFLKNQVFSFILYYKLRTFWIFRFKIVTIRRRSMRLPLL